MVDYIKSLLFCGRRCEERSQEMGAGPGNGRRGNSSAGSAANGRTESRIKMNEASARTILKELKLKEYLCKHIY